MEIADLPAGMREHVATVGDCWEWTARRNSDGYGVLGKNYSTHRLAYELSTGAPIPKPLEIDHTCSNRACCNPAHLEAVTRGEHLRRTVERRTHCKNGHEFTAENTYQRPTSGRGCRACGAANARRYLARKNA